jgi:hypothetical protein
MTSSSRKVVQTTLTKSEYKALVETLSRKQLSIQEGLHDAALKLILEENKLNANDSFFKIKSSAKGSGLGDLSIHHDKYLYHKRTQAR